MYGWANYLLHEKAFITASEYIDFVKNKDAVSHFLTNQVILLGAEIEAAFKRISLLRGVKAGNMGQYKEATLTAFPSITSSSCVFSLSEEILCPFQDWATPEAKLPWWAVYTDIKHSTIDPEAKAQVALNMLAALQILLLLVAALEKGDLANGDPLCTEIPQYQVPVFLFPCFKSNSVLKGDGLFIRFFLPAAGEAQ